MGYERRKENGNIYGRGEIMTDKTKEMINEIMSQLSLTLFATGVSVMAKDGKLMFYDRKTFEGFSISADSLNLVENGLEDNGSEE